ncbi:MAG: glutamyl-tRNA reductase [Epulopiscium sp. Nuni2H_MBin003]|nr:MAG: glutamyl-tRNA reductase [Epulopiscium sp. Nuni2H_MBin003]
MSIQMVGIDYSTATIDERSIFSFTKKKIIESMAIFKKNTMLSGCIIISTCNRTELWFDIEGDIDILEYLTKYFGQDIKNIFAYRINEEAYKHLFQLTAGLKSQIFGEDQIISQVKDALLLARENKFLSNTLEVLFRMAITSAKKIKTSVTFVRGNLGAAQQAIEVLENKPISYCMVIGNGQIGKLVATKLANKNSKVYVTVRSDRHKTVEVPEGCMPIEYEERKRYIDKCDVIVSATSSPHFTISYDMVKDRRTPLILIDLAVPRDIDTQVCDIANIMLYDIDDFTLSAEDDEALTKAKIIIDEELDNFYTWLKHTDHISQIQAIKYHISKDIHSRLKKKYAKLPLTHDEIVVLSNAVNASTTNVINKLLFHLRDNLDDDDFEQYLETIERLYDE